MQTADLLRNAAQALGVTTAKLDEVLQWQRFLVNEMNEMRERVAKLEKGEEWSGDERRNVRSRLADGDQTFLRIEEIAKDAEATANEAKRLLAETLKRRSSDGTRIRSRWWKLAEISAPVLIPMLISGAMWLYIHFKFLADLVAAAKKGSP